MQRETVPSVHHVSYELTFDDPEKFVREYESNICHAGLFVAWQTPPPIDTMVHLVVNPPLFQAPLLLDAIVVFSSQAGVGLQLTRFDEHARHLLEGCVRVCSAHLAATGSPPEDETTVPVEPENILAVTDKALVSPDQSELPSPFAPDAQDEAPAIALGGTDSQPAVTAIPHPDTPMPTATRGVFSPIPSSRQNSLPLASSLHTNTSSTSDGWSLSVHPPHVEHFPSPSPGVPTTVGNPPLQPQPVHTAPPPRTILEGTLDRTPLLETFLTLAQRGATGTLNIEGGATQTNIYFQRGSILRAIEQPPNPNHLLGEMLVASHQIKPKERDLALEEATREGALIGQVLIRRKSIAQEALGPALRLQLEARIMAPTRLNEGRFSFIENARPSKGPPMPVIHPIRLIFRSKVEEYRIRLPDEIEKIEHDYSEQYAFLTEHPTLDINDVGLNDKERRFVELVVTGAYYLKEIHTVSNLSRRHTHAVLFALLELGLVEFKRDMALQFRILKMRDIFRRKISRMDKETLFNVLEVHWMAHDRDIQDAYTRVKHLYDCSDVRTQVAPDIQDMSKAILKKIEEAHIALQSHEQRQRYRAAFLESTQVHFTADLLHQQGDMFVFKGDYKEAIDRYVHVLELDPSNKEVMAKLQDARARASLT